MFETNGDEFAAEWERELEKLEDDTDAMIDDLVQETYEESQRLVPVDTGALKDSGATETTGRGSSKQGRVTYGTKYAAYVGLGTRYMSAQPYLWTLGPPLIKKALNDLKDA